MPPLTLAATLFAATLALVQSSGTTCHYEGRTFMAGSNVPTGEKCLTCVCGAQGGAPVCRLQVCPQLPVPPPKNCVLVHRRDECCQRLVCEAAAGSEGIPQLESREGTSEFELELSASAEEDRGCVVNGTRYAEGSAMSSSTLCEYCYCVRGKQQCVKPQCEMPLKGCTPKYRALTCCPVSYDCSPNKTAAVSTTATPPRSSGCYVAGNHHKDGMQVRSLARNCEHCYCLRGAVRCVKLECAPPLMGCEPVFAEGKCCPVQYNCSKIMTDPLYQERSSGNSSIFLQLSDGVRSLNSLSAIDLRKHREITKNETADSTTMKSEPFEILKRIENEGAALLKKAASEVDNTSTSTTSPAPTTTQKASTTTQKASTAQKSTKITTVKATTPKPTTQKSTTVKIMTTKLMSTTTTTEKATTTSTTTTPKPLISTTEKVEEEVADQVSAESRIDLEGTTEGPFETTTILPYEMTTILDQDDEPEKFEILKKEVSKNVLATTFAPTTSPPPPSTETSTAAPSTSPPTTTSSTTTSPPPVMSERVDVLDELDDTTIELLDMKHKAADSVTPAPRSTLSPLIEALINSKNRDDGVTVENEYGEALPPSLPNITMIPFLPEDAVVAADKKEDGGGGVEFSVKQHESSTQFGGSGVPVVGAIPPKRFSPPSSFVGGFLPRQPPLVEETLTLYQSSPGPDEILTSMSLSPQFISITTSTPEADSQTAESALASTTTKDVPLASHIRVASGAKACIAPDGRQVKHGDLLAPPGPCEVCRCDYGTVLCHEEIECMKLIKGSENEVQKRVDSAMSHVGDSVHLAPENKIAKDEFSLDSVFKFLFEAPSEAGAASSSAAATTGAAPRPVRPAPRPREPAANSIAGVLKLAGCNIYGRMYRVGRIISELSDQCRECKCTELGVECQPLYC